MKVLRFLAESFLSFLLASFMGLIGMIALYRSGGFEDGHCYAFGLIAFLVIYTITVYFFGHMAGEDSEF